MHKFFKLNQKGTAITEVACVAVLLVVAGLVSLGFMSSTLNKTFIKSGNKLQDTRPLPAGGGYHPTRPSASNYTTSSNFSGSDNVAVSGGRQETSSVSGGGFNTRGK